MLYYLESLPGAITLGMIWGIMGLGVFITNRVLNMADLTVDGSFATGGAVCAVVIVGGGSFWLGLLLGFLAGLLCGLVTGLLHTLLDIPPILAGILTQLSLWSINLKIMKTSNTPIAARSFDLLFYQANVSDALWKIAIISLALVVIFYIFFGTELGASIRATGNNPKMARAQGINTKFNIVLGLMISNGIIALSGALLAQYQGFADINMGKGAIVFGLCAVVIGQAITKRITPNFLVRMLGVIFGSIIYQIVFQTVVFFGMDTVYLKMVAAIIVALFLGVPYLNKKYFSPLFKKRKKSVVEG
ncbi:MAG TPA: ABC transporter permease [Erysipelotrichaceae bacterium]|nr:ABC transporter permease [Erysipelotrichaceae bacterium]